jgi:hypothetical protein
MAKQDGQRRSFRANAEGPRNQREAERLANRERDSLAQDEKTARLRALRLAKEAADQRPKPETRFAAAKTIKMV